MVTAAARPGGQGWVSKPARDKVNHAILTRTMMSRLINYCLITPVTTSREENVLSATVSAQGAMDSDPANWSRQALLLVIQ
jgi:hypothetical protein